MMDDPDFRRLQRRLLGRYSLERVLGRGGMATVYLARELALDRPVALKALHPELAARPEARARFVREARLAARLAHPHIVPIYGVEADDASAWLTMALIDGETLGARIRARGALPPGEAERVVREIAWALGYAHLHGVVHRDLTLDNVLLERGTGRAILADFGIARDHDVADGGTVFGTPGYLPPEVIRGEPAGPAADLYALGVVGYTVLTGRPPFTAPTAAALLAKHLMQEPPPPAARAGGASRRLTEAVMRCLAKEPAERPADVAALRALLDRPAPAITLAPALRGWFDRFQRIAPLYAAATPILALQTYLLTMAYFRSGENIYLTAGLTSAGLSLTLLPLGGHLLFEAGALRRLRAAGFTLDDVRAAEPHWLAGEREARDREGLRPLASRVIFDLTVVGAAVVLLSVLFADRLIGEVLTPGTPAAIWFNGVAGMTPLLFLCTMIGVGIGFVSPGYRIPPDGGLRRRILAFWRSRAADTFARFAGTGQRRVTADGRTLHRPTAMVLGLAIDDLWRAMPAALRRDLGDVPGLAATLQRSALEDQRLLERLDDGDPHDDAALREELAAARAALAARQRDTVAMLERVRLQLLRALATRERSDALTGQLDAARALETALLGDIAGHARVRRLLRRSTVPVTPLPTPA